MFAGEEIMTEEFKMLVIILVICIPIGLFIGIAIRKSRPMWCKSYVKFVLNGRWWLFAYGLILFIGLSIMSFVQNRPYFGTLFVLFALLEALALFRFGFKKLTPEQAARIDTSDPTKLWPVNFLKHTKNSEQKNSGD